MQKIKAFGDWLTKWFTVIVIVWAVFNYFVPQTSLWGKSYTGYFLGIVLFGMGLTLTLDDFKRILTQPLMVVVGTVAHFVIMPLVAVLLCWIFRLDGPLAVGVILVGCCPSGTASNVMVWLSKGDLALAVAIAAVTTLLAPLLTPALIWFLASAWLPVSFMDMFWSILQLVMLPIVLGVLAQRLLGARVQAAVQVLPLVSVVSIVMIVCAVVAASQAKIAESGLLIMAVVMLHNSFGYLLGYLTGKLCKLPLAQRKSLALEVGMQNSGLGAALAAAHFSPLAAVPSALFSVWHNISGALLSTWFRRMEAPLPVDERGEPARH